MVIGFRRAKRISPDDGFCTWRSTSNQGQRSRGWNSSVEAPLHASHVLVLDPQTTAIIAVAVATYPSVWNSCTTHTVAVHQLSSIASLFTVMTSLPPHQESPSPTVSSSPSSTTAIGRPSKTWRPQKYIVALYGVQWYCHKMWFKTQADVYFHYKRKVLDALSVINWWYTASTYWRLECWHSLVRQRPTTRGELPWNRIVERD